MAYSVCINWLSFLIARIFINVFLCLSTIFRLGNNHDPFNESYKILINHKEIDEVITHR